MKKGFQTPLLAALAILVIGVGVAVAGDGYGYGSGPSPTPTPPQETNNPQAAKPANPKGKQWQAFKRLESSRLAQIAYMTGKSEIDDQGENDAGDPDAKGSASFLHLDEKTVCYGFILKGADTPTQVHIHKGQAGQNGPVVLEFANLPKNAAGAPSGNPGTSSGCKTVQTPQEIDVLSRIRRNPQNYYVNFHTETFPKGAVRGQIGRVWYSNND